MVKAVNKLMFLLMVIQQVSLFHFPVVQVKLKAQRLLHRIIYVYVSCYYVYDIFKLIFRVPSCVFEVFALYDFTCLLFVCFLHFEI